MAADRVTIRRIDLQAIRLALGAGASDATSNEADAEMRKAAVATILRERAGRTEVLLIRRAEHGDDPWSGHMAFPGGRQDPGDATLVDTAIRETREEIGVDLAREADLLGRLPAIQAVARGKRLGLTVESFVFELRGDPLIAPNHEVAEVLWAPLDALEGREGATTVTYEMEGTTLSLPGWDVEGRIVWGLTYRMLQQLLDALP